MSSAHLRDVLASEGVLSLGTFEKTRHLSLRRGMARLTRGFGNSGYILKNGWFVKLQMLIRGIRKHYLVSMNDIDFYYFLFSFPFFDTS